MWLSELVSVRVCGVWACECVWVRESYLRGRALEGTRNSPRAQWQLRSTQLALNCEARRSVLSRLARGARYTEFGENTQSLSLAADPRFPVHGNLTDDVTRRKRESERLMSSNWYNIRNRSCPEISFS